MKLPFCPACGGKSFLYWDLKKDWCMACVKCPHEVKGHVRHEGAIRAFLWSHENRENQHTSMARLACGCLKPECKHKFFEAVSE